MIPLLSVRISAEYVTGRSVLRDTEFELAQGEVMGLVGQSGSGKSTLALALPRLLGMRGGRVTGSIKLAGYELMALKQSELRRIRGSQVGFVFQNPIGCLNPSMRLGAHLDEAWLAHSAKLGSFGNLLATVSLPSDPAFLRRYPGEISVGQAQRFVIAMGIMHRPQLLIADEPISALDVITQAEILDLFARLNRELNMAILYISHDLLSVSNLCHRVAILRDGQIVESGSVEQIFLDPRHEYTQALVAAIPKSPFVLRR